MTDKEWKELWEYAECHNVLTKIITDEFEYETEMFGVYGFIIYKDGCIRSLHCDEELVKFNDYKQIEKFIDSLLTGEYN